jgi:hypothetical protein
MDSDLTLALECRVVVSDRISNATFGNRIRGLITVDCAGDSVVPQVKTKMKPGDAAANDADASHAKRIKKQ